MPRYDYRCESLNGSTVEVSDDPDAPMPCVDPRPGAVGLFPHVVTLDRPVDERDDPVECDRCGGPTRRLFNGASQLKMVGKIGKR